MSADDGAHRDQARELLARAKRSAPRPRRRPRVPAEEQSWSGAAPDERDPATLQDSVAALVQERAWGDVLRTAGIPARWTQIVGADNAAHCRPERLEGGELFVVAESTAWAANLTLLSAQILARLDEEIGKGVVRRIRVHGPAAPDWRHGPLRVRGPGPRDTYG